MIHDTTYVGIDVSKMQFDVHIHPGAQSLRCGTSPEEIAQLVQRLARLGPVAVGLEASGGYEGRLADSLHAAGLEVYVVAPARVRNFARAIGQLAKTDRIDAAMIARYLMAVRADLTPYAPDPANAGCVRSVRIAGGWWPRGAGSSVSSTPSTNRSCGT